jgi:hypothetical protein
LALVVFLCTSGAVIADQASQVAALDRNAPPRVGQIKPSGSGGREVQSLDRMTAFASAIGAITATPSDFPTAP